MSHRVRIDPIIRKELDACPFPWSIRIGSKHLILTINDKKVTILPRGSSMLQESNRRPTLNARAIIRRFIEKESR